MNTTLTVAQHLLDVLAAPEPTPTPGPKPVTISGAGVMGFIVKVIVPIVISIVAVTVFARGRRGDMSGAVTSTGVVGLGIFLLGLATSLAFLGLGDFLVGLATT